MTQEMERTQRRGIRFPTHSLEEALRLARIVQEQGGGRLSLGTTAVALELSPTSSSFISRVSSARHFGLVDEDGDILRTTPLAKKILRPTNQEHVKQGLGEAFQNFPVFKQLLDRFHNTVLPERQLFENILVQEYGISDVSKNVAYDVFVDSGKFSGQVVETGKGLFCGIQELNLESDEKRVRSEGAIKLDSKLVDFILSLGALRTVLSLRGRVPEDVVKEIVEISNRVLSKALELASELGLPASKMSMRILIDRLKIPGAGDIGGYVAYLDEALKEDLNLGESAK